MTNSSDTDVDLKVIKTPEVNEADYPEHKNYYDRLRTFVEIIQDPDFSDDDIQELYEKDQEFKVFRDKLEKHTSNAVEINKTKLGHDLNFVLRRKAFDRNQELAKALSYKLIDGIEPFDLYDATIALTNATIIVINKAKEINWNTSSYDNLMNDLLGVVAHEIAHRVDQDKLCPNGGAHISDDVNEETLDYFAGAGIEPKWVLAKLEVLDVAMRARELNEKFIQDGIKEATHLPDAEKLSEHTDELAKAAMRLRKYGLKSIAVPNKLPALTNQEGHWSFLDANTIFETNAPDQQHDPDWYARRRAAALITYNEDKPKELGVIDHASKSGVNMFSFPGNETPHATFFLGKDGQLYDSVSANFSLKEIFKKAGKLQTYELLRAFIVNTYFDATAPAVIASMMPKFDMPKISNATNSKEREDVWAQFFMPRLLYLKNVSKKELKSDYEQDEENSGSTRTLRRHGVTYFIRRLPDGYKPSEQAKQLALEHFGFELDNKHTFVRGHERGLTSEQKILGHIAVKRQLRTDKAAAKS